MTKAPTPRKVSWHSEICPAYPVSRTSESPTMPRASPWVSVESAAPPTVMAADRPPDDEHDATEDAIGAGSPPSAAGARAGVRRRPGGPLG